MQRKARAMRFGYSKQVASNTAMRPMRPVPPGCCKKARLRRCKACEWNDHSLRLAPNIPRFLAATHHVVIAEMSSNHAEKFPN